MHKAATALQFGIYNFVRKHTSLKGLTPAQAAGVETDRWTLERVIEVTDAYRAPKYAAQAAKAAAAKRRAEDAVFLLAIGGEL